MLYRLLLLVVLLTSCVGSTIQEQYYRVYNAERFMPLPWQEEVYRSVAECLGRSSVLGYHRIHWFVADSIIEKLSGRRVVGLMHHPRRIFLERRHASLRPLVAHELIHFVDPYLAHDDPRFSECEIM